jgi:hypothetical protein
MNDAPQPIPISRLVRQPYSKLNRLCQEASVQGGTLKTYTAVADAVKLNRSRITQLFGHGQEAEGSVVPGRTLGDIVRVFNTDGVRCELAWFYLDIAHFEERLVQGRPDRTASRAAPVQVASSADWERRAETVLPDLVELTLPPPRPGNETPDTHYVDATLLFGTAWCDYDPEDGQDPRTVAIALTNARLALGSDSYSPLPGTMLGERVESPHFKRVAGGLDITGPAPNGTLDGNPSVASIWR